jgi:hypothetical protein
MFQEVLNLLRERAVDVRTLAEVLTLANAACD